VSRVYWDRMLLIYWLEDHPQHLCTSVSTVGEVLTGLYKRDALDIASQVREAFRSQGIELISFTPETAGRYARVRAVHRVSPADAIHRASAAHSGVDLFLTNGHRLEQLTISGIQFIAGMDVNLF
jgi:predicted nucleic acid-binding protein